MSIQDQINAAAAGSTLTIDAEECLVIPIEEIESAEAMMEARSISAETMTDDDQIIAFNLMTDQEVSPLGWLAVRDRENEIAERVKCLATDLNSAMVAAAETGLGITLRLEDTYLGSDGAAKTPQVAVTITKVL